MDMARVQKQNRKKKQIAGNNNYFNEQKFEINENECILIRQWKSLLNSKEIIPKW